MPAQPGTPIVLRGTGFGVDFNPDADALRIVSDTGQNLRALPSARTVAMVARNAGDTLTDGNLNYTPGVTETGVNSAAYTNDDASLTPPTALFDIDAATQRDLVSQSPPNSGTLSKVADLDIGLAGAGLRHPRRHRRVCRPRRHTAARVHRVDPAAAPDRAGARPSAPGLAGPGQRRHHRARADGTGSPLVGFTIDIPAPPSP